jgi:hypothetical protein
MATEQRAVQIVRMGTLTVYEISEDELRQIETGGPSSLMLNFGIGALSVGIGIGATLIAAGPTTSRAAFDVLVILTVVGILAGLVLLSVWRRLAKRTGSVIQMVRQRGQSQITASITTISGSTGS